MPETITPPAAAFNPLLHETLPIPFQDIRAEQVEPAIEKLLADMRSRIAELSSPKTPRTYGDLLLALDTVTSPLDFAMAVVRHLESVVTTPELRAAHNEVQGPVSAFYTSIPLHAELWAAVKTVQASTDPASLAPVHRRYLEKTVRGFVRAGADLDPAGKEKLEALNVELTRVTTKFTENVLDSTNAFELLIEDKALLAGLPDSARNSARESARSKGREGWRLTLQAPSYTAVMTYLDDVNIRRQIWEAYNNRATEAAFDNRCLIVEILRLRRDKARLLGFHDFADFVLEERMAHTGETAQAFLEDLREKTEPHFHRENQELIDWARKTGLISADAPLEPWDVGYLAEKQRLALYDFDEEELRPYFQLEQVMSGMFDIFSRLFGIQVVPNAAIRGWDPAVEYFEVRDTASGELLGGFYTDWYPRENKRGGAWMDALVTGNPATGEPHIGLICGNLTPPLDQKPSLLTHREVETIFHEFGHLLHHVLSRVPIRTLAGTNVPWDFVELPSQIMENWCIERAALDTFARHYETGERIPAALFDKMYRARTFRAANMQMRQLGFGTVDLKLHREFDPDGVGDVLAFARNVLSAFTPAQLPESYAMIASFTHLFSSPVAYGAGYYSYKWAEVLDADAFTRFNAEGVFNPGTGGAFREVILASGDSRDPALLYREFMGRDPDAGALLKRLGLRAA